MAIVRLANLNNDEVKELTAPVYFKIVQQASVGLYLRTCILACEGLIAPEAVWNVHVFKGCVIQN